MSDFDTVQQWNTLVAQDRSSEETVDKIYKDWATEYDKDLTTIKYKSYSQMTRLLIELGVPKTAKILDGGAGTGFMGEELKKAGFTDIDALEPSEEMIAVAKSKNVYKNIFKEYLIKGQPLPLPDRHYDVVTLSGVVAPGHAKIDDLEVLLPVVKKGGLICWCIKTLDYYQEYEDFKDGRYERYLEESVKDGKWQPVEGFPKFEEYIYGKKGIYNFMRVL